VVGVTAHGFRGLSPGIDTDLWVPMIMDDLRSRGLCQATDGSRDQSDFGIPGPNTLPCIPWQLAQLPISSP
jgi:hypothetical protein